MVLGEFQVICNLVGLAVITFEGTGDRHLSQS